MGHTLLRVTRLLFLSLLLCCGDVEAWVPLLTVSPSWLSPGASVTLSCRVKTSSSSWVFYWYRAVPDLPNKNYTYELLPDGISGTVEDSYILHGQKQTAGYACRAKGGNPEDLTGYSEPKFVWSEGSHPEASLTVSPRGEKLFYLQDVQLKCQGSSAAWRVRKFETIGYSTYLSYCSSWGSMTGSSCRFRSLWPQNAVFWCESGSGEFSNAVNLTLHKPESVLTVSPSWLNPGAPVTLSCNVRPPSVGWRFYWYQAAPDGSHTKYNYKLLPGSTSGTENDSFIIHGQKHTAGFACRAERRIPEVFTDYSEPKFVWSTDSHPAASLSVSPDREKLFTVDDVLLSCQGNPTGWRVMKFEKAEKSSYLSHCSSWGTLTGSSCTIKSRWSHKAVYWCESETGEFSNAVNITLHTPDSILTVSPSWLNPGASVTLSCEVKPSSAGWRIYWYKAVPDLSKNNYRYELLPGSISGSVQDSIIVRGQKNTAGFACRAEGGNPEDFTDYSEPKFIWSADPHPAASLSVSPDREQHFTSESVTLNCGGNSTEWRVKRFREINQESFVSDCSNWGNMTGSSCTINSNWCHKAVYWCESETGEFSNSVNISVQNEGLLLVSPVHPVTEGASVTLSCRRRGENNISDVIFYHNDKLIQNDSRGELKISAVSQSDEGFYKCEHSGEVSPQSWMAVKAASRPESSSFPLLLVVGTVSGIVFILLLLLLLLSRFRNSRGSDCLGPSEDSGNDPREVQHITYALVDLKHGEKKGEPGEPVGGAVYSVVKTGATGTASRNVQ